ncbi:MAG: ATP-binding cassette domain-containing protein [Acidobacteria bacterium]|nr:ATP-binding cassette domain-containing protein [Acidobacteriota bacterium]
MNGQTLSIRALVKTYSGAEHPVFDGFFLEVEAGALVALVGVSGVGKTTLLNCIAGLDTWDSGEILVGGEAVPVGVEARALFRRSKVGLAFQEPHLLPEFTVRENLLMPCRIDGSFGPETEARAEGILAQVGLADLAGRLPNQLSGGQAARAGLARALVRRPALWLLDEPTGNLDPDTAQEVFQVLLGLHAEHRPTTLMVTHNLDLAGRCHRTVRLRGAGHDAGIGIGA